MSLRMIYEQDGKQLEVTHNSGMPSFDDLFSMFRLLKERIILSEFGEHYSGWMMRKALAVVHHQPLSEIDQKIENRKVELGLWTPK